MGGAYVINGLKLLKMFKWSECSLGQTKDLLKDQTITHITLIYRAIYKNIVYFRYILTTRVFFRTPTIRIHHNSIILLLNHRLYNHRLYENITLFEILHMTTLYLCMTGRHL